MAEESAEEARQKLLAALNAGFVEFSSAGEKYLSRGGPMPCDGKPDFTVVDAEVTSFWGAWSKPGNEGEAVAGNKGGMEISWGTVSGGFGTLTIVIDHDGRLKADTETMGKDFCKAVFAKLVDSWEEVGL